MSAPRPLIRTLGLAFGLTSLLAACGGGGSGGADAQVAPPATKVSGDYTVATLALEHERLPRITSTWGRIRGLGLDRVGVAETRENRGRVLSPDTTITNMVLQEPALGALRLFDERFGPGLALDGRATRDGTLAVFAPMIEGAAPGLATLVQAADGMAWADVVGDYHLVWHGYDHAFSPPLAAFGEANVTPAATALQGVTRAGPGGPLTPVSFTLRPGLDDRGRSVPGASSHGAFRRQGDVGIFLSSTAGEPANFISMAILIRKGAGRTNTEIAGTYAMWEIVQGVDGGDRSVVRSLLTFDGEGRGTILRQRSNVAGRVRPHALDADLTYGVREDGGLSVITGFGAYVGAVSADGEVIALTTGVVDGPLPGIALLLRIAD